MPAANRRVVTNPTNSTNLTIPATPLATPATWAVLLAGALTLAVAMGIGRFAFTPLLPLMMRDGQLDAAGGAELAAANYLGYLVGALSAGRLAGQPLRLLRYCLPAIAVLTAAAGLVHSPLAWGVLRFGAGVCSAWALVGISAWSLTLLAQRGQGGLGGLVFTGVGAGITLAGLLAWWAVTASASALWLLFGAAALLLSGLVIWLVRGAAPADVPVSTAANTATNTATSTATSTTSTATSATSPPATALPPGSWPLVVCYAAFGFGYILPATFLPAMARALLDDPRSFGLVWPVFGLAALASVLLTRRWVAAWPPVRVWAVCQFLMAAGVALPLLSRSAWAVALAALLVGGTFVLATVIAMQMARALVPQQPAPLLARMTAAFALGQIAGPLLVRALAQVQLHAPWQAAGAAALGAIDITLACATVLLLATAAWLWRGPQAGFKRQASAARPG